MSERRCDFYLKPLVTIGISRFIIGLSICDGCTHGASASSNKLSNLLKSRSSSVSADRTRPLPRTGDLYIGLENVAPTRSINNAGPSNESRIRGKSISRDETIKWMSSRGAAFTIDAVSVVVLFAWHATRGAIPPSIFYRLSMQRAR